MDKGRVVRYMEFELTLPVVVSIVALCFSVYFGILNNNKNTEKQMEERVADSTRLNTKLDLISQNTADIKADMRKMSDKLESQGRDIVSLDASVKSAHHRIDGLEKKLDGKE